MAADLAEIHVPPECREMIRAGALVAVSHSGGKDSQAMTILLSRIVPRDQLVAVHAPLGGVEWPGTIEHIEATLPVGVPLIFAPIASGKTLLERVEERGLWPSNSARWCTSDFKTGPIQRELRRYVKAHPRFGGRLVNAMGKAEEAGRLDSPNLPVLYGSPDLQTCLHECRVTVEDALFLATLRPVRELKLLNLVSFSDEPSSPPCEDLDHATVMLFLAEPHAYPISRAIACAARDAGYDGLVYPSFFSMLRNGVQPFESYSGLSNRSISELRPMEAAKMIPNLAIFGRPIQDGMLTVTCINRVILRKATYSIHFGPAGL